jgi:hypothetical protein
MKLRQMSCFAAGCAVLWACRGSSEPGAEADSSGWTTTAATVTPSPEDPTAPVFELDGRYEVVQERLGQTQALGFVFDGETYQRTTRGQVTEAGSLQRVSQQPERWELLLIPETADSVAHALVLRPTGSDGFEVAGAPGVVFRRTDDPLPQSGSHADEAGSGAPQQELDPERMIAGSGAADATWAEGSVPGDGLQADGSAALAPTAVPQPAQPSGGTMRLDSP